MGDLKLYEYYTWLGDSGAYPSLYDSSMHETCHIYDKSFSIRTDSSKTIEYIKGVTYIPNDATVYVERTSPLVLRVPEIKSRVLESVEQVKLLYVYAKEVLRRFGAQEDEHRILSLLSIDDLQDCESADEMYTDVLKLLEKLSEPYNGSERGWSSYVSRCCNLISAIFNLPMALLVRSALVYGNHSARLKVCGLPNSPYLEINDNGANNYLHRLQDIVTGESPDDRFVGLSTLSM